MSLEIYLTSEPIPRPYPLPESSQCGAVAEFYGVVRGEEQGRAIRALVYEAYEAMAQKQLAKLASELLERYPCHVVRVAHRVGEVPVGEAAVYLGVLAPHRQEAFGFLREFMDRLKADVPIWKIKALEAI